MESLGSGTDSVTPPLEIEVLPAALEASVAALIFYCCFHGFIWLLTPTSCWSMRGLSLSRGATSDIACKSVSALFGTAAASSGIYLLLRGSQGSTHEGGGRQQNPLLKHIYPVVVAYFLYDVYAMYVAYVAKRNDQEKGTNLKLEVSVLEFFRANSLIVVHHLLVGAVFTPIMMRRLDHEPGELMVACALVFEASTPFVSLRAILSYVGLKRSPLYIANGAAMVLVFLCCRILIYPAFYVAYAAQRGLGFWQAVARTPIRCSLYMLGVLAPQLYWLGIMVRGAAKVLNDNNDDDNSGEAKARSDKIE